MKIKKLNEERISLSNEMMQNVIGGRQVGGIELGTRRVEYSSGAWETPSSDRTTQEWTEEGRTGCTGFWRNIGSNTYPDSRG